MSDEILKNYSQALDRFSIGYNKSVILSSVTTRSLAILDSSLRGVEQAMTTIVASFEEIRATAASTSGNAVRIDEMMAKILAENEGVDKSVVERMGDVDRAAKDARHIDELFRDLQENTKRIVSMTGSIRDVSDRTNILAINASIEAARAGSVGKGFRIIANEVRNLAGQTGDFAKQIETTMGDFRASVGAIDDRMRGFIELLDRFRSSFSEILATFQANAASVGQAGSLLSQITGAVKEESLALTEGLHSLETISSNMQDTHAVFEALSTSHEFLDTLLGGKG
jgi:methyl-accepting chemotaxis protein